MSKFLKVIVNLFLVAAILVAGAILVPPVLGVSTTMIDSASIDTNLPVGSITYSENVALSSIVTGDKILIEEDNRVYVYVVESADVVEGKFAVVDEIGQKTESEEYTLRNEALKVVVTIPLIGYVMVAMHSVEGLIIMGLVVLFVIILFILSELWKKTDDEDEETSEEDNAVADNAIVQEIAGANPRQEEVSEQPERADVSDTEVSDEAEASIEPAEELTSDELAQAIAATLEEAEVSDDAAETFEQEVEDAVTEEIQEEEEAVQEDAEVEAEEPVTFVKVPRPTLDEILVKAETAGDKPEIISYDSFGITVVDYSNCI